MFFAQKMSPKAFMSGSTFLKGLCEFWVGLAKCTKLISFFFFNYFLLYNINPNSIDD